MAKEEPKVMKDSENFSLYGILFEIGWEIALPLVALILLGVWIDDMFNTKPLFILLGILLSLISSFYAVWKTIKRFYKKEE